MESAHEIASIRRPYFFKVYFPHLLSEKLGIPRAFWKHIEGESSGPIYLKGPSGDIWNVDLVKNASGLSFENGWKEFVVDHSIVVGEFLVFRYDGHSHFTVLLFDTSACEKQAAFYVRSCQYITVLGKTEESEKTGEEASEVLVVSPHETLQVTSKGKRRRDNHLEVQQPLQKKPTNSKKGVATQSQVQSNHSTIKCPKLSPQSNEGLTSQRNGALLTPHRSDVTTNEIDKSLVLASSRKVCRVDLREKNGIHSSQQACLNHVTKTQAKLKLQSGRVAKTNPRFGRLMAQRKCVAVQEANILEVCQSLNKKSINSSKTSARKQCSEVHSNCLTLKKDSSIHLGVKASFSVRHVSLLSQRRPVTDEEVGRAFDRAQSFKSENPFTVVVMRESYVYVGFYMYLPQPFVRAHLPKYSKPMILWDPTGKSWNVNYVAYKSRGGLSGGWAAFACGNNLEENDVCIFELIKKHEIRLHIFRVVEEPTPLVRRSLKRSS